MAAKPEYLKVFLLCMTSQLLFRYCYASNKALGRNIEANVTCGNPAELYYKTWQGEYSPSQRNEFICNASSPINAHPPTNMVDGTNKTYWQSKASVDNAFITIDLTSVNQKFIFVRKIDIEFGAYQRPAQIEYSKSTDGGRSYQPWHYYVTFQSQCTSVPFQTRPFAVDTILCTTYQRFLPIAGNETVSVDLYGGRSSTNSLALQSWMNATNIRLKFSGLHQKFDRFSAKWHHYTVSEISVTGDCFCSGHASACNINATNGERTCQCQNNACGPQCDICCPAFNQYAFKQGKKAPFEVDASAACLPCNCHNHSSKCIYNQTIADAKRSLNASGFYSGGGVCQECQHKTTGINCDKCIEFNYRPKGKSKLAADVCKECNCSRLGTRNETGVTYLDCIRDEAVNITGMAAGDCYCKQNVFNRQCDVCRPGFYNLTAENPSGCQDCACFLPGTVNGSNVCTPDAIGNCPCKNYTEGRVCGTCKDQFFNLTAMNLNGCERCGCDPGGRNSTICNKITGQCECKSSNITGRKCDRPEDGYYYPNFHYLRFTIARTNPSSVPSFRGELTVPVFPSGSGIFYVIVKYRSSVTATATVTVANAGPTETYIGNMNINSACASSCFSYVDRNFSLAAGNWNTYLLLSLANIADAPKVQIDALVLLPSEFNTASILGAGSGAFLSECNVLTNNMSKNGILQQTCLKGVFSATMGLLGEPIDCACNLTGSVNGTCEKYDGQCPCKPGVTGKKCDKCLPRFYNFSSTGCTPCNCSTDNKECNQVTGQCTCPSNTIGRTCNQCESLYWGWNSTTGCKACGCNATGSANMQCDLQQGNCSCKYGVGATKCSECLDTFTGFSSSGCSLCNCSNNGSRNAVCDKLTNQCPCKANTFEKTCDQCKAQSFYLSAHHAKGCLSCICMGILTNCSSSQKYVYKESLSSQLWRIGNETTLLGISSVVSSIGSGVQSIPAVSASIQDHSQMIYWAAPAQFVQRSWVGAYGGSLDFTLFYGSAGGAINNSQYVILKGKGITIYHNLTKTSPGLINVRRVQMTEASWRYSNGSTVTRSTLLLLLAKPSALLISASSYQSSSSPYTSRLGGLSISNVQTNSTSSGRALQVEKCECGTGYTGSSCERCAVGYKRSGTSTHSFLGTCVPCQCNGHSNQCDPDTGRCLNCLHNTTGDSCQFCVPSFYGNATNGASNDCTRCPCDAPRTTSSLCGLNANGTVQCSNCSNGYEGTTCDSCSVGFFGQPMTSGGSCSACQCTNNSNVCNTTSGVCQNCLFNTSGQHCERCSDGWYGDAVSRTCQACSCSSVGSLSSVCNYTTGQCDCKSNVRGMNCTSCMANSYGFNNVTGCLPCNCNPSGSIRMQCNDSGICSCLNNTINAKCDRCEAGYFGLPVQKCQACNCNSTGSINGSCSILTGQCFCRTGVQNRNCDSCMKQHTNFNSSGCTACPQCSQLLQKKLNVQFANGKQTYTNLQTVTKMANLTSRLQATEQRLNNSLVSKRLFDNRISTLQAGINRIKSDALSQSISSLMNRTSKMTVKSSTLINTSIAEQQRFQRIRTEGDQAARNVISVNSSINSITTSLEQLKLESQKMLNSIQNLNFNFTHQEELGYAQGNATEARALLLQMQNTTASAASQDSRINETAVNVTNSQASLAKQQIDFYSLASNFSAQQQRLTNIQGNITRVKDLLKSVDAVLANTSKVLDSVQIQNANITQSLNQSRAAIKTANETVYGVNGLSSNLNKLSNNVDELKRNVTSAQTTVNKAVGHAANLSSEANTLTNAFQPAKQHGSNAVNAVKRYEEISKLINQSMELSKKANTSIQQVYSYLQISGNQNLTQKASTSLAESQKTLTTSINQQSELADLQRNFSQANKTFKNVEDVGNRVSGLYGTFRSSLASLSVTSEQGNRPHSLETAINSSNFISSNVIVGMESWIMESNSLLNNITALNGLIRSTNTTATSAKKTLDETWKITNNITKKLSSTTNSPTNDTNTITGMIQQFNSTTKPLLEGRLARIQSKINALKLRIATQQAAISLNGTNSVLYKPASSALAPSSYSEIQMDFKTTQTNVFLMFFGNESASAADKMSLKVVNSKVVLEYTMNGRLRSLTNWEVEVSDGNWRRVYVTRQGVFSRLTVSLLATNYSRTYSLYEAGGNKLTSMTYPVGSSLYLGGFSANKMINSTVSSFAGCIDNVRVNKLQISLWNYSSSVFKPNFCNSSSLITRSTKISGASFFGNGFVKLKMGNFSVRNYSRIEFEFRTLHQNGTLFAVQGVGNAIIYSIVLVKGSIHFLFTPLFSRFRTSRGSYSDGNIYKVLVSRSTNHISLSVTSVVNGTGETVQSSSSSSLLESGTAMFFGGVNDSSGGQLDTGYKFAGCIMNVSISNTLTGKNDAIKLNDASLLQYSSGVSFDGCLKEVSNGLRFLGSGYTSATTTSSRLSSLDIVFKTNEPSGVLFYAENKGMKFYIALVHGNIFLDYKNASKNARTILDTRAKTLNDGLYHTLRVVFANSLMSLIVDQETQSVQLQSGLAPSVELNGRLYVGGVQPVLLPSLDEFPVVSGFLGDMQIIKINEMDILKSLILQGNKVSLAGVMPVPTNINPTPLPTTPPPTTPPPSCAAASGTPQTTSTAWVGFDAKSILALRAKNEVLVSSYFKTNYLITVEFRAFNPYGVVFYARSASPGQFIALELVNGKLVYRFDAGEGVIQMRTTGSFSQGAWTKVYLLRMSQFGAILISESGEYHNNGTAVGSAKMNISFPIFLGGAPDNVRLTTLTNPSGRQSFRGCVKAVQVGEVSKTEIFDLSTDRDTSASKNLRKCYTSVIPSVRLIGDGYLLAAQNLRTSLPFSVSIKFRTSQRSGIILHLYGTNISPNLLLEQVSGQIVLSLTNNAVVNTLVWTDPNLAANKAVNSSYALCNNAFHTVTVTILQSNHSMNVDTSATISSSFASAAIIGSLYVGGSPRISRTGLVGCIDSLTINGKTNDLAASASSTNSKSAFSGCSGT